MFDLQQSNYPYLEEINDGVLRQFSNLTGSGKILDVGCGRGTLAEAIKQRGFIVWGIELSSEACQVAKSRLNYLIQEDILNFEQIKQKLDKERFEVIIFSDVLEHVYDPLSVLKHYSNYLTPKGKIIISVPNAAVWSNRFCWLLGQIKYTDTGVMDRTHVRFFTFTTAQQLIFEAGLQIIKVDYTPFLTRSVLPLIKRTINWQKNINDPRIIIESPVYQSYLRYILPIEQFITSLWKSMLAFRIILVTSA